MQDDPDVLGAGELSARIHRVTDYLDHFGDLTVTDIGARQRRRRVEWSLAAPGAPSTAVDVQALYRETWLRQRSGWHLAEYTYEYLDRIHDRRLAYHHHPLAPERRPVPHAHCGSLAGSPSGDLLSELDHRRATEVDIREANDEFMTLYAAERAPDCSDRLPLRVPRE